MMLRLEELDISHAIEVKCRQEVYLAPSSIRKILKLKYPDANEAMEA